MTFVDGAIGSMVTALREADLTESTELIITAKHGQSPIDPSKLAKIGDQVSPLLTAAGVAIGQVTTDDVALVWLQEQHQTAAAVKALQDNKAGPNTARIEYVLSGASLADRFGNPLANNRTPDLIVQPIPGTIYTKSKAKVAEHGGFTEDDTHVALLVVNGSAQRDESSAHQDESRAEGELRSHSNSHAVHTTQIAPTILEFLALDPMRLQSVRSEGTVALPR